MAVDHVCEEFEHHAGWWRCKKCKQPIPRYETVADAIKAMRDKLAGSKWAQLDKHRPLPHRKGATTNGRKP